MQTEQFDVYGVGHALVDVQYAVEPDFLAREGIQKGVMTLIDAARQEYLAAALNQSSLASCSGGSAANTLIGVASFGGSAHLACQVGTDCWGAFFLRDLEAAGVGCSSSSRVPGPTGCCTVFITPDADRTLNTCLGVGGRIGPEQVDPQAVAASRFVYLEGYLVLSGNGMAACRKALRAARACGVRVALTLSDPAVVAAQRKRLDELLGSGTELLFCNEDEAMACTGADDRRTAGQRLSRLVPMVCVTCGADGAFLYHKGTEAHVASPQVRAVDTTGAGDMFAGGVLYGLTHDFSFEQAGRLGVSAAAHVVTRYGCRMDRSVALATASTLQPN